MPATPAAPLRISRGTRRDYLALAHLHYRAGPPATIDLVLVARDPRNSQRLAGVLVLARPTLNGPWRTAAFPRWRDLHDARTPRARARALNAGLRTIARVIVAPAFRGRSVATLLVRAAIAHARRRALRLEALATMGEFCPIFARAGMREVVVPRPRRDARLSRDLRNVCAGGLPPHALCDAARVARMLAPRPRTSPRAAARTRRRAAVSRTNPSRADLLRAALTRWARDSRATRALLTRSRTTFAALAPMVLAPLAARALCAPRRAWAWEE